MPDLRRVLDGDTVPDGLTEADLLELYRRMVLLRTYDERSLVYHRQGRIGTYAIYWNHEAIQAGATYALTDDDWIFPSYRESAIGLVRGMPAETILQWWRGHPSGWWNPADWNIASICVPIGTHVPHATGLAWGDRARTRRGRSDAHRGGALPRRPACDRRRPERVHRPGARRGGTRARVRRSIRARPEVARPDR